MTSQELDALRASTTTTIEAAAEALGCGRTTAYRLSKSGQLADGVPVLRVGRKLVVPTRPLLSALGYNDPQVTPQNPEPNEWRPPHGLQ